MAENSALLLYDGTCGFCAQSVQFVLRHESPTRRALRFASLQSPTGAEIRVRHPQLNAIDSVIWYEPATDVVLVRSAAVLQVLRYLGGIWSVLAGVGAVVPRALRDFVYDFVARHRHRLVRGAPACVVPTAEQRPRFIDFGVIAEEIGAPR
jgi:predicted DCC family thiol-disulfide oxidoreductase YuxK